jgi:multidrug efflux pump subunit AcrA (membrane-fusion protein)
MAKAHADAAEFERQRLADLLHYVVLTAPTTDPDAVFVITRRWADPKAYLQPSLPGRNSIFTLARIDRVKVVMDVPELEAVHIRSGDEAVFEATALPGRKFRGVVSRTPPALDPVTRTRRVEMDLDNAAGDLLLHLYGTVTLTSGGYGDILMLPTRCIHREGQAAFVYRVSQGVIERVPIAAGGPFGLLTAITGNTLKETDQIVVISSASLKAGDRVEIAQGAK